jgi:hypothetical protein
MISLELMLVDKERTKMCRPNASDCTSLRMPATKDPIGLERATRAFHALILTTDAADLVVADRERLRLLLEDLRMLARKTTTS